METKKLDFEEMENLKGSSCAGAAAIAVAGSFLAIGVIVATGGTAAAVVGLLGTQALGLAGIADSCATPR